MPDDSTVCPQCAAPVQGVPLPAPPPPAPQAGGPAPASTSAWLNVPSAQYPSQGQYPPQAQYPGQGQPYSGMAQAQTDGGAIVSLVLGISSFALCLSFITGIPAIIVGHISWSKIRRSAGRLKGEGMALAGLILGYLSLPFILIIAAIVIPNLLRARMSANESAAMSTVRTISTLQVTYNTMYASQGYAPDLSALGNGPGDTCNGTGNAEHACLLDGVLGAARCTSGVWCSKGAYKYTISSNCGAPSLTAKNEQQGDEGACKEFVIVASPITSTNGLHNYCSIKDAVVRSRSGGPLTVPPTVEECAEWAPI